MTLFGRVQKYVNVGQKDWAIRRRIVALTLIFCAIMTMWGASSYMPTDKATLIINQCFTLATFVIGYYVFGAIVDDHLKRKHDVDMVAAENPAPAAAPSPVSVAVDQGKPGKAD